MKYYAVTEDPNELMHYGVLGMKWGVRHDNPRHSGSRRRSPAYKKAQSKLGKMMKSGIKKAEAHWKAYNSPQAKEQRFMSKAMQQARTGTLKYGKLTDDQVRRVTERLALERDARQFGGTEKAKFGKRLKTAIGEGVLLGTTEYVKQRMGTRGRMKAEEAAAKRKEKYESKERVISRKAEKAMNEEYYKTAYEEGFDPSTYASSRKRAQYISDVKNRRSENEYTSYVRKVYAGEGAKSKALKDVNTPVSIYDPNTKTIVPATRYDINEYNSRPRSSPHRRRHGR